jgi:hypothetical protein
LANLGEAGRRFTSIFANEWCRSNVSNSGSRNIDRGIDRASGFALCRVAPRLAPKNGANLGHPPNDRGWQIPPSPLVLWNETHTRESGAKIFGFKELIDKIFRTKDLASADPAPERYARRVTYIEMDEGKDRIVNTRRCDG